MEKSNNRVLNELLVNLFHNVMDAEAKAVITDEFKDITNNDMHILEAIGIEEPKSMSQIAGELHVTVGTLTTNMNSLEKKGYLARNRSTQDKRVVLVTLTEKGRKAFFHHRDFHRKMIHTIIRDLDEEEMKTLIKCLGKLDTFFREGNEDFVPAKDGKIFEILQVIERHEGYEEKYKSVEHEDEAGPAGTGGTGVDRCAGECESGGNC